jgi:hypothetical protein
MSGILFLIALIGILIVVMWEITNDRVDLAGETRGLLRMRKERPTARNEEE